MKSNILLFFGIFVVMALSNAIVPVLPLYHNRFSIAGGCVFCILSRRVCHNPACGHPFRPGTRRNPVTQNRNSSSLWEAGSYSFRLDSTGSCHRFPVYSGDRRWMFCCNCVGSCEHPAHHRRKMEIPFKMMNIGLVVGLALSG